MVLRVHRELPDGLLEIAPAVLFGTMRLERALAQDVGFRDARHKTVEHQQHDRRGSEHQSEPQAGPDLAVHRVRFLLLAEPGREQERP